MTKITKTQIAIDVNLEQRQGKGFRTHLGASIIGKECARAIWYTFRWAKPVRFNGRMLRLFDRGNREEPVFVKLLQNAGIHVVDRNLETGEQFRVSAFEGHFGGSQDAKLRDVPDWPNLTDWLLGEFKTHNDKSFKELKRIGLQKSKFVHYIQMQVYMRLDNMPAGLYIATNKNDDELYIELVTLNIETADQYIERAGKIIEAMGPPPRISENAGWYLCRFCDYNDICHAGAPLAKNCRTCVYARPVENAAWICTRYQYQLTEANQHSGCRDHTPIPDLIQITMG